MSKAPEIREILERHDVFRRIQIVQEDRENMLTALTAELARLVPADPEPDDRPMDEQMTEALGKVIQRLEGGMVTRWVVLVESIAPDDGSRGLWCQDAPDQKAYDTLGMLAYGDALVRAGVARDAEPGFG